MGRFFAISLLLAACGDNSGIDTVHPGAGQDVDPNGNATATPRFAPQVCGVSQWTTTIGGDLSMDISVVPRAVGATVLAVPTAGGAPVGFSINDRMELVTTGTKIGIDSAFTRISGADVNGRLTATSVQDGAVFINLLDDDLTNPQYIAKLPGTFVADPAFLRADGDLIMPIAGDDGLHLQRFADSFEPTDNLRVMNTKPAASFNAVQIGLATLTAWSTVSNECYMMFVSGFAPGTSTRLQEACAQPRLAAARDNSRAVMVFEGKDGVRLMNISHTQMGGDAVLLRPDTRYPRIVHDGTRFWVSYIDVRGDVIVGYLDGNRVVSTSLNGPQPAGSAYDLAIVDGAPWVFTLDASGYTAHRMCVTEI